MDDLVTAARTGDADAQATLWAQVKRLAFRIANRYRNAAALRGGADADDLAQCAALGVLEALRSYDPEKGSFTTWLGFYVSNACRECLGMHRHPEYCPTVSLDAPIGGDTEDLTLADTLPDESAAQAFEDAEHARDNELLRRDLEAALDRLPIPWQDAIRRHDLEGQPLRPDDVQPRRSGLQRLRRDYGLTVYRPNYHRHKGLAAFRSTWSSVVEDEVIRKLDRRN